MNPLRQAIYILLFFVGDKSQNPFAWEEVKGVSKGVINPNGFISYGQQN